VDRNEICKIIVFPDIVTRAKLDGDRFGHFCVVRGRISGFPIDFGSRPYNSLALPCQSAINRKTKQKSSVIANKKPTTRFPTSYR